MQNSDRQTFLRLFFERRPAEGFVLIWTVGNKLSRWFQSFEEACAYIDTLGQVDCYFGVGYSPADYGPTKRCKTKDILSVPWFYADLDYQGEEEAHKKKDLPPTEVDARSLVVGHGLDPSILVHSGHGLQAYWLLDKPWIFSGPSDRVEASVLSRMIGAAVKQRAEAHGWNIDSVHDLARVLRVPGTWNVKGSAPVQAKLIFFDPHRVYTRPQLEAALQVSSVPQAALPATLREPAKLPERLDLQPAADPPWDKLEALIEVDSTFEATWRGLRTDLASLSEGDLSISNLAARANWSDQEIANLIVAFRRRHGKTPADVEKGYRPDYVAATITKARDSILVDTADKELEVLSAVQSSKYATPQTRARLLEVISDKLGIQLRGIVKFLEEPPVYALEIEPNLILEVGEVSELIDRLRFRKHVAAALNVVIPRFKDKPWDDIARALLRLVEERKVADDSTDRGEMAVWLQEYLENRQVVDIDEAALVRCPFFEIDRWFLFSDHFYRWALSQKLTPKSRRDVIRSLKKFGCSEESIDVRVRGQHVHRRVWGTPLGWTRDQDEQKGTEI
jgi:hypothetical protein